MIIHDSVEPRNSIADSLILDITYHPITYDKMVLQHFSSAAQGAFRKLYPHEAGRYISPQRPEVIALRLLDFLSSKQGYIRRKGHTFRTTSFYLQVLPIIVKTIQEGRPIKLDALCLCTTLANVKYAGESPYPHMAAYIAFENLHKIANAVREIYPPGINLILGYEGTLLRPLYFHSETVTRHSLTILHELNYLAYKNVTGAEEGNPIEIIDATQMIEQAFGSFSQFLNEVEHRKQYISDASIKEWRRWYCETVSNYYFPSETARKNFITEQARWRAAVHHFKHQGGMLGKGFMTFDESIIPFTPSGRRSSMLALQLIPKSSYLPHQRIAVYDGENNQWAMRAYQDLQKDQVQYAPRYVRQYLYPFYFKKLS